MNDEVKATIKNNPSKYTNLIIENPTDNTWLYEEFNDVFSEKKFSIPELDFSNLNQLKDKELAVQASIKLHQSLKSLPRYVLSDESFWSWINFEVGYEISQRLIKLSEDSQSTLLNHYFFSGGIRRGKFFGVFSRLFFRALLTFDETMEDPYYLTKHVNYNPNQIRNLTWRTYSNNFDLVKRVLKIQIKLEMKYGSLMTSKVYEHIAKLISNLGSSLYVDLLSIEELEQLIVTNIDDFLKEKTSEAIS
jgi:hypothetical protein